MEPERWTELQPLFDDALELRGEALTAYLDAQCAGRVDVRAELEALLSAHQDSMAMGIEDKLIGGAIFNVASDDVYINATIGEYRLEELIGKGGMGEVYLAVRIDGAHHQKVALKLVRPGLDSEHIMRRFLVERQILAQLDHPNIARLWDGGVTADGRPYLVMEYVEGTPLIRYCEESQLSHIERLFLFRQVCEAVHFAHRNLVVHRDLKPSNILVDRAGVVKLLDFGIAKLLDPEALDVSVAVTRTGVRVMTPEYAAPEQVRGEFITTATDVYALGALLYELISGKRVHQFESMAPAEIERVICEREPAKPSELVAAQGALKRQLSDDLDNIALKALQKEPTRRYASVEALGEDINRYLSGLPVLARPDTFTYRVRKFVRRHRLAVSIGALTVLFLVGFGISMAVLASRIANQAEVIAIERDRAEEISSILVDLYKATDPNENLVDEVSARDMLEAGSKQVLELDNQPETQAELYEILVSSYLNLSLNREALAMAEASLEVRQKTYGLVHAKTAWGTKRLGDVLRRHGRFEEARLRYQEALVVQRNVLDNQHPDIAQTLLSLSGVLNEQVRDDEAVVAAKEAVQIFRAHYGEEHLEYAKALDALGDMLRRQEKSEEAVPYVREAIRIRRALLPADHPDLAWSLTSLGHILVSLRELEEAETLTQEALSIYEKRYGREHAFVTRTLSARGRIFRFQNDFPRMEATYREMLTLRQNTLGILHPFTGAAHWRVGQACLRQGKFAEAETHLLKALDIRKHEGRRVTANILRDLIALYKSTAQSERAEKYRGMLNEER